MIYGCIGICLAYLIARRVALWPSPWAPLPEPPPLLFDPEHPPSYKQQAVLSVDIRPTRRRRLYIAAEWAPATDIERVGQRLTECFERYDAATQGSRATARQIVRCARTLRPAMTHEDDFQHFYDTRRN
jgi:hypothetical protein